MVHRILFVDDDENAIAALRRATRAFRHEFGIDFTSNAAESIASLASGDFDAVVTDLRMPGMDGVAFLREIERKNPSITRIVLSGESNSPLLVRAMGIAHRVIGKPCPPERLLEVLREAMWYHAKVNAEPIRKLVVSVSRLPTPPRICRLIEDAVTRERPLSEIGALIAQDPASSAHLLRAANSAYFGTRRAIASVEHAVSMLGLETTKSILFASGLRESIRTSSPLLEREIEVIWEHSRAVADLASELAKGFGLPRNEIAEAYSSAIVHDIGKMVLAFKLHESKARRRVRAGIDEPTNALQAERDVLGADHAEVGAHLLALWGLPDDVSEVALHHEAPLEDIAAHRSFRIGLIAIADLAEKTMHGDADAERSLREANLDDPLRRVRDLALALSADSSVARSHV